VREGPCPEVPEDPEGVMRDRRYRGGEQTWKDQGACAGDQTAGAMLYAAELKDQAAAAKRWCAACPVQQECLNYAIVNHEEFGVWGGVIESRRRNRRWQHRMRSLAS
jgi:hypothetical protein